MAFSLFWTFFQVLNGIIHLQINWSSRALVRPPGGNAYIGLFAMAAQMWAAKMRERWMARAVAWIVVANFAPLTIPSVSTAPLYQSTSEWCSLVLDKDPQVGWSASSILA